MKTKWVLVPVIALSLGCTREIDKNVKYIDGQFSLFATSGEKETKTVIQQDGSVFWSPNDCIKVYYGNTSGEFTSTNTDPAASAEFTGSLGSFVLDGETEFKAVYPYSDATILSGDNLRIDLPSEQTAVEGTFANNLFISVAKSKDVNLHFYNVCGGVCFSLARGDIKKVVFRGNNGEILAGRLSVGFASNGVPQVNEITSGKVTVTLLAPNDGTFTAGSWYYLVLVPRALTKGYTMELYTDELVETISSDSSVTVRRSAWGVLKNLGSMCIPEAIDLGLSVKWASFNLGATRPEEYGDYFAWGDTEPKESYSWETYKWCMGSNATITKYCSNLSFGYNGFTDNKTVLDPEDDAAHVNLGGKWRMPTDAEWKELMENCTLTWTAQNGVTGRLVTASNGNSIFLPAAGGRTGTNLIFADFSGDYWSSSLSTDYPYYAWYFYFSSSAVQGGSFDRYHGQSIRPVLADGAAVIHVSGVNLDKTTLSLTEGDTYTLKATISPSNATDKSVTWSSSNTAVATVSSSGVVTAKAVGSATITVKTNDGGKMATCAVTVQGATTGTENGHDWVDLGLPSGLKWATCNVGASKPEEYGNFYAWGETETKSVFSWSNYVYRLSGDSYSNIKLSKYNTNSSRGTVDNKTILDLSDDAAHVNWGGKWRMPTTKEFDELRVNCSFTWITQNGVNGSMVTGKNGKSIFLPASGFWEESSLRDADDHGYYWSSSLDSSSSLHAFWFFFNWSNYASTSTTSRRDGLFVRPVIE